MSSTSRATTSGSPTSVSAELRRRRFARGALRVESPEVNFGFDGEGGVERAWLEAEPHGARADRGADDPRQRGASPRSSRRAARVPVPRPRAAGTAGGRAPAREARRPRGPDAARAANGEHEPAEAATSPRRRASSSPTTWRRPGAVERRSPRSSCARSSRRTTTRATSATQASRARRTRTSPRRSAAIPTSSSTAPCCARSARATTRSRTISRRAAEHTSATERAAADSSTAPTTSAPPGSSSARSSSAAGRSRSTGEVIGLIPSGLFARFGDVFEGFVPARRLHGDYYELNDLGTALVGRRGGYTYRLGDELDVRVEEIRRARREDRAFAHRTGPSARRRARQGRWPAQRGRAA